MVDDPSVEVLIVDDDPLVRAWLRAALRGSEFRVCGEAESGSGALDLLARRKVDLLLVDFRLSGGLGVDFVRELRLGGDTTPVLLMTAAAEPGLNERAREAGAQAAILKTSDREALLGHLRETLAGVERFDPRHPRREPAAKPLSPRELEVLELLAAGLTNRQIAARLSVGEESVKTYLARLYTKLDVQRRAEAVSAAHRLGLLG